MWKQAYGIMSIHISVCLFQHNNFEPIDIFYCTWCEYHTTPTFYSLNPTNDNINMAAKQTSEGESHYCHFAV
jgi:hypothetical protein